MFYIKPLPLHASLGRLLTHQEIGCMGYIHKKSLCTPIHVDWFSHNERGKDSLVPWEASGLAGEKSQKVLGYSVDFSSKFPIEGGH
jgi:hypothetical protein